MSTNKSCTNCPGATDHDTAHCPLFLLRERFCANEELPPKWYALVLRELDAFTAELRGKHPEQAEGLAQGELASSVRVLLEVPQLNGEQAYSAQPIIDRVRAALAQPSPAEDMSAAQELAGVKAIINDMADALKRLTFHARTTGGTAGPDAALMSACERAERVLSLGGMGAAFMRGCDEHESQPSPTPELERPEPIWQFKSKCGDGWKETRHENLLALLNEGYEIRQAYPAAQAGQVPVSTELLFKLEAQEPGALDELRSALYRGNARHWSDCATNSRGCPELLGPCNCGGYKEGDE